MALIKPVKVFFSSNQRLLVVNDHTNFTVNPYSSQTVAITTPGETIAVTPTSLGNYVNGQNNNPMNISPSSIGLGDKFLDGIYRVAIKLTTTSFAVLEVDERILFIPAIDACILKKTDTYLRSSCDNCKSDANLKLLQELVVIRQAAQLDLNLGQYAAAAQKVTLLSNLCTGASCKCICGC
jgi:hypothetical protein